MQMPTAGEGKSVSFYQEVFGEALQEGRQEGVADTLLCLVTAKFGPPTPVTRQRLAAADTLLMWSERLLGATSLDELFGDLH